VELDIKVPNRPLAAWHTQVKLLLSIETDVYRNKEHQVLTVVVPINRPRRANDYGDIHSRGCDVSAAMIMKVRK